MTEQTSVDTSAAAIAAVMEGVTPGPWTDDPGNIEDVEDYSVDREDDDYSGLCWSGVGNSVSTVALVVVPSSFGMDEEQAANARFIAWCREGVPALSAQLTAETARADAAEAERDAFRAVLAGAEYCNIDEIGAYSVPDASLLGVAAKRAVQNIIADRDALRDRVAAVKEAREKDAAKIAALEREFKAACGSSDIYKIAFHEALELSSPDDGRPCNTDVFLAAVLDQLEDKYDVHEALNDWVAGDWDKAMVGVTLPSLAKIGGAS